MQYNKEEFKKYYDNYLEIKEKIETIERDNFNLLKNEKLKKTVEFYDNLDREMQEVFVSINCNTLFNCYFFNLAKIKELESSIEGLAGEFYQSEAFPFTKDHRHFFIKDEGQIIDAINDDNIFLDDDGVNFLVDVIKINSSYDPTAYDKDDLYIIKVLYDKYKDNPNLDLIIKDKMSKVKDDTLDNEISKVQKLDRKHIEHLKWKLSNQTEKIYYNSKGSQRKLLLYETEIVNYEIALLEGARVEDIYQKLEDDYKKGFLILEVFEYQIDALVTAYYHLIDDDFKKNSGYFHGEEDKYHFEIKSKKINKRILEMRKRK